ncbi:HalOD1 output domain-containing protein [Halomarina salina]|uniref:HalOD1 output domain-containing protein n=1 Tax=Halomarina salina TaxID=1872699 RepID=A0ABD5RI69_9EURY|nr:HalOD1 output domain-containing protein [Halomarina salina]
MSQFRRVDDAPSTGIVGAVASAEGVPPRTLEPLYDTVDPDALDALVADPNPVHVQFEYEGHIVTVDCGGRVELENTATVTAADADSGALSD